MRANGNRANVRGGALWAAALLLVGWAAMGCRRESQPARLAQALTSSSNASNFNGTAIAAGRSIWFSSVIKVSGVGSTPAHLFVSSQHIAFTANGVDYDLPVPDGIVTITPGATKIGRASCRERV